MFVSVDSGGANGRVPSAEVQKAFRAEAQKQLARISEYLAIYSEP